MNDTLIYNIKAMRLAQKQYFALAARARKTKLPADWAASANALKESKRLEELVDAALAAPPQATSRQLAINPEPRPEETQSLTAGKDSLKNVPGAGVREFDPDELDEDDEDSFEHCSDCDLPDACSDFGCAIKQGLRLPDTII